LRNVNLNILKLLESIDNVCLSLSKIGLEVRRQETGDRRQEIIFIYSSHPPTPHTPHPIPRKIFGTRLSLKSEIDDFFKDRVKFMADIVDIAVSADNFKTLVTAVQAANLVDALKSPGPFTVFAPTDEAFAKLPPGTITTLVQNIPQLTRILTYHVVAGKYMQEDLAKLAVVTSLEGSPIPIDCSEGFEVKNATVVAGNIEADNGVIHVIDTVILMG
jgi:uncharacterized surface protein with fasciclin (FAS1) repeats